MSGSTTSAPRCCRRSGAHQDERRLHPALLVCPYVMDQQRVVREELSLRQLKRRDRGKRVTNGVHRGEEMAQLLSAGEVRTEC